MKTPLPVAGTRTTLGIAWALALIMPALAQSTAATVAPTPNGNACSSMMASWQSAEAEYSALNPADLNAYNVAQNEIDRAAHRCEAGQDAEAARIMDASKRPAPDLRDFKSKASP